MIIRSILIDPNLLSSLDLSFNSFREIPIVKKISFLFKKN